MTGQYQIQTRTGDIFEDHGAFLTFPGARLTATRLHETGRFAEVIVRDDSGKQAAYFWRMIDGRAALRE